MMAAQQPAREQGEAVVTTSSAAPATEGGLAVLALAHVHGHLHQPELGVGDANQRLDLRRLAHVRIREQRERAAVTAYIPLVPSEIGCLTHRAQRPT